MKSQIFNLIILDESGSMSGVTRQTIGGCNETINTIKTIQEKFAETQEHFVAIYAFQSDGPRPSRYLIKNVPIAEVKHITAEDYEPHGCTPLYDAVGSTLTDLKVVAKKYQDATGSITIITDGMENSSRHYSHAKVASMIEALKELGWNFNFIGANIDVDAVSHSLNIDNAMSFCQDEEGTRRMFEIERMSRCLYNERLEGARPEMNECWEAVNADGISEEEKKGWMEKLRDLKKKASMGYFKF